MNIDKLKRRYYIVVTAVGLSLLFLFFLWLIGYVKIVFIILCISILLAYVLVPAVNFFNSPIKLVIPLRTKFNRDGFKITKTLEILLLKKGFSRIVSITIVYLIMFLLLEIALSRVFPIIADEFAKFLKDMPRLAFEINSAFKIYLAKINKSLDPFFGKNIPRATDALISEMKNMSINLFHHTIPAVVKVISTVAFIFIIPLITFYILMDVERYKRGFMRLIPVDKKDLVMDILKNIDYVLGRYIRGQLIVCICIGVSVTIALKCWNIEYAYLIGAFSGIIDVIPYLGVIIGMIPALLLALKMSPWIFLGVLVTLVIIHWSEGHLIIPLVVGHSIGLPPLVIVLSLLLSAEI